MGDTVATDRPMVDNHLLSKEWAPGPRSLSVVSIQPLPCIQSNPYVVSLSLAGAGLLGGLAIEEFMDHERNEGYEAGYDNGYDNGFDNGYDDGGGDGGFF